MADIYDLVQKKLSQGGGRNQFYDQTADIAMQIPQMIQNQRDAAKVSRQDSVNNLVQLMEHVNTPEGFATINSSIEKLSNESGGDSETLTTLSVLKGINRNSRENYETFKTGVDRGFEYINSDSFPTDMAEYERLDEIAAKNNFKNEDGTGNIYQYLYAEKEKVNSLLDKIGAGFEGDKIKFNYGKGRDRNVIRKLKEHSDKIDIGIRALAEDGVITKAEAYHMFQGNMEYYQKDKEDAMTEAKGLWDTSSKRSTKLSDLMYKAEKGLLDKDDIFDLEKYVPGGNELSKSDTGIASLLQQLDGFRIEEDKTASLANQKYKNWTGRYLDPSDVNQGFTRRYVDDGVAPPEGESVETGQDVPAGEYDDASGQLVSEETESVELGQNLKYPATNIEEESEGMSYEAIKSPVFQKKIENINKIKNILNTFEEVGTRVRPLSSGRGGEWVEGRPRTSQTRLERLLDLEIGEKVSIDKVYQLRDKTIPNWENRKTQIESRINAIAELYPKILRDVGWKKVRLPNKENIPYSTQVELKTLLEEKSALNKKLKDGRRFFGYVFGKQGLKEHGGGDDLIKKYEKNIKKLNQAENNLATFKTTHKLK